MNAEKIANDLKTLTRDAEEFIQATAGDASEKAREARSRLKAAVASARETCEDLQDRALAGAKVTDKVIREHPYQSIGFAFGVGLLLGVLGVRRNGG